MDTSACIGNRTKYYIPGDENEHLFRRWG